MSKVSQFHRLGTDKKGITKIYYKHNINNTTKIEIAFIGGASQDKIPGTAHFVEHMILKEAKGLSENELYSKLRDYNAITNGYTSENTVSFPIDVPNRFLDKVLELYSKLLFNNSFKEESINLEREAIKEEINMLNDNSQNYEDSFLDYALSSIRVKEKSFSLSGTHEDVDKIDAEVLKEYIDRVFVAENMVISVVSNLSYEEINEKLEKYITKYAKSDKSKKITYPKAEYYAPSNHISIKNLPNQKTVQIDVAYMSKKTERESHLFSYIENYIFNQFAGKMLKETRSKRGLVYSAQYEPILLKNNMTLNTFSALTSKEKVNQTLDVIGEIITKVASEGITQEELDACKQMVIAIEEDRRNGLKTIDPSVIMQRYLEGTEVFFNNQLHKVKELTLDQVNKYFRDTYTNTNVIVKLYGCLPEDCYSSYKIQKMLKAKLSQCYLNVLDGNYYDYETRKKLTEKSAFEKLFGITDEEKVTNLTFLEKYNVEELENKLEEIQLRQLPVEKRIELANKYLKTLGINFQFHIELNGKNKDEEKSVSENIPDQTEKSSNEKQKTQEENTL